MTPIKDLEELIKNMKPLLLEQLWFYCCVTEEQLTSELLKFAFAMVRETESITLILPPEQAESLGQKNDSGFKRIELQVYSCLEAVGLTAAISQCLKENNISANVVAGFHHDHVFVPEADAKKAIDALNTLTSQQV